MLMSLSDLLAEHDGVLSSAQALECMTRGELRWKITSGRWQQPCRGVVAAQSGPLTDRQVLRVAQLWAGPQTVIGGLTAATLDGFRWLAPEDLTTIHLLVPKGRKLRPAPPFLDVTVRYSAMLSVQDVHPVRQPRRTRVARSLIDAASWAPTSRKGLAVLAAGVQQRVVRTSDLAEVLARNPRIPRRKLMFETLADIEGGAQALSELDFTQRVVRQNRLPEPDRQAARRDSRGRRRWLDVVWEKWRVIVEIDGAQHADALQRWDDMDRDNDLQISGYRVLRFPSWLVRTRPDYVAMKVLQALREAGFSG
jgi:very-short-patch-repair endonuclease